MTTTEQHTTTPRERALQQAIDDLAAVFGDGMTAMHVGPHFTCGEAERIARALQAGGYDDAAETWLDGHALGDDDPDDAHHGRLES